MLLVAVVSSGLAQQSSSSRRTGGGDREDRRLALRRFQNRNRSNSQDDNDDEVQDTRRQQPRRLANQDKIAERRRELLQRNGVARRRKVVRTQDNEIEEAVEPTKKPENVRIRITPEPAKIEDPVVLVEKIGNNDNEIINAILDRDEEAARKPFTGTSEVRTISSPNGIRTGNEQVIYQYQKQIQNVRIF